MEQLLKDCTSKLKMHSSAHPNGKCVLWTGCKNKKGYGQFRYRDPRDASSAGHKTRTAHRVALMVHIADFDVPASLQASHLCNNKLCINVDHLVFESCKINNERKNCFSYFRCTGHEDTNNGGSSPDCIIELSDLS